MTDTKKAPPTEIKTVANVGMLGTMVGFITIATLFAIDTLTDNSVGFRKPLIALAIFAGAWAYAATVIAIADAIRERS